MYLSAQSAAPIRAQLPLAQKYWEPRRRTHSRCPRALPTIGHYGLDAITADQAAQQAMPKSAISSKAGFTQTVYNNIVSAADAGRFVSWDQSQCSKSGVNMAKPVIATTVGGLALKFLPQAFAAGPIVGGVVLAVGALGSLFGIVFGHHAAAVAQERKVLCAAVPSANDTLSAIYDAVGNGTMTPQQGQQALAGLLSQFSATVAPIIKSNSSQCNAACVWVKQLTAIVARQSSILQDTIDAATKSPVSSIFSSASAGGGIPSWLLYAAGGVLLWKVL